MTLRAVLQGDEFTRAAVGGFIRDRAKVDGFIWETDEGAGFLEEKTVQMALVDLKEKQAGGRRRRR